MATDRRYSDHLDMLLALISYLALTQWRSRSPNALATDLCLPEGQVVSVLDGFPGIFRKNSELHPTAAGGQLDADLLQMLLDFVSDQARAERESTQSRLAQRWLLLGVVVAAAASIVAAIIQAVR